MLSSLSMVNETGLQRRGEWTFPYKARLLLPYARRRLAEHQREETLLRKRMATMIQDPATFHNDAALQQVKRDIDRHAALREQFEVYCHEFVRLPEQEYRLALGDVVFFGLLEGAQEAPKERPSGAAETPEG
jgi:hypothetical protein